MREALTARALTAGTSMFAPLHRVDRATQQGKAVLWLLVALIVAAAAWWYAAPQTLPEPISALLPASPNARARVYKWHDAKGRLQITSVPPTDRPYETLSYDPRLNVVPSANPPPSSTH